MIEAFRGANIFYNLKLISLYEYFRSLVLAKKIKGRELNAIHGTRISSRLHQYRVTVYLHPFLKPKTFLPFSLERRYGAANNITPKPSDVSTLTDEFTANIMRFEVRRPAVQHFKKISDVKARQKTDKESTRPLTRMRNCKQSVSQTYAKINCFQ